MCVDCVCKNDGATKVKNITSFFTFSFHGYGFIQILRCIVFIRVQCSKKKKHTKGYFFDLYFLMFLFYFKLKGIGLYFN
jgi:hypothetical protein